MSRATAARAAGAWKAAVGDARQYSDQVARWRDFEAANQDAKPELEYRPRWWSGSLVVCGERRTCGDPEMARMLDGLEWLAKMGADAAAIEADYPGWRVRLCEHAGFWHWECTEKEPDTARYPLGAPAVCSDSAEGLRAALAEYGA